MKTTRWVIVAALLGCAGIRLQAQDYDAWVHRGGRYLLGPSRQLLLVHGIFSSSSTWNTLTRLMHDTGDTTWHVFAPDLDRDAQFSVNRDALVQYMTDNNLQNDVAVVAHSMGGLIARLASRSHPMQGIMSVGSPHYGTPLARAIRADPWNSPISWYTGAGVMAGALALRWFPEDDWTWAGTYLTTDDIETAKANAQTSVNDFLGLALLDFAEFLRAAGAMRDLAPGSPAMAQLTDPSGYNLEQATRRVSVTPTLGEDADYQAGPFILLEGRERAHQAGDNLQVNAWQTFNSGFTLMTRADWTNTNFWTIEEVGATMMALGNWESDYWTFWNDVVVGGRPNDGVVPLWSMVMPNSETFFPAQHMVHSDETTLLAPTLQQRINLTFVH